MKRLLLLLLSAPAAHAALLLNDFNSLTTLPYNSSFDGEWSDATAQFNLSSATIANFGSGTPTGDAGNGAYFFNEGKSGQSLDDKFGVEGLDRRFDEVFLPRVRKLEEFLEKRKRSQV